MKLEEFLNLLDGVKPSGNGYIALCPAHDDRSPSFSISEAADGRILFYCHAKCKQEDVLNALGLSWTDLFPDKKDNKKARYSPTSTRTRIMLTPKEYQDRTKLASHYQDLLEVDSLAARYLESRGIPLEIAKDYGLGYCPPGDTSFARWKYGRITAPHTLPDGRIVNLYGRAIGEEDKFNGHALEAFKREKHRHLPGAKGIFNARALDSDILYITEGVFDALSLLSCGYPAIAIFGLDGLSGLWQYIKAHTLVLCLDNDKSGQEATKLLAMQATLKGKWVEFMTESQYKGCKDINELLIKHGNIYLPISTTQILGSQEVAATVEAPPQQDQPKANGYYVIGSNERDKLESIRQAILAAGILSFDYETNTDPDDESQDPQDSEVVGVSLAWEIGHAVYLPMDHEGYAHNWNRAWLFEHFLKPLLEDPDVTVIAHNLKFEYQHSLLNGVHLYGKAMSRKLMDTMLMLKALTLKETINASGRVVVGLKPATKALLADPSGMVHGLMHIDDIKSFKETVGYLEWTEDDPSGGVYKSGKNKGKPKQIKKKRQRRFNELSIDAHSINYACSDADWALGLYYKLLPLCEQEGVLDILYSMDIPRMLLLGEYELAGWHVDAPGFKNLEHKAVMQLERLNQQLDAELKKLAPSDPQGNVIVPAGRYPMGEHRGEAVFLQIKTDKPFSWNSTQHKQWLLFHVLGVPTDGLKRSAKTGLPSVDKDNLQGILDRYSGDNTFLSLLREKAEYDKILSTYVKGMGDFIRKDTHKIHTNFNLVDTWRLSSKKPNLQNIPRPESDPVGIRKLFIAPNYSRGSDYSRLNRCTQPVPIIKHQGLSGETFWIGCDYSQLELRIVAALAQEKAMIEAFRMGHDLHSATAKQVFNLDCSIEEVKSKYKPYRYKAKAVNFGLVYGITEYGLSRNGDITVDEAKELIDNYFKAYPAIKEYIEKQKQFARARGYVTTFFGHRRPIIGIRDQDKLTRRRAENKAINTPVQGTGADIIANAMVAFRHCQEDPGYIQRLGIQDKLEQAQLSFNQIETLLQALKPVMQIHDELIFECPVEYAANAARLVKAIMEQPIPGFTDIIPLVADPAIGKRWAHILDVDWTSDGQPFVVAKSEKGEPSDVTVEEIAYALPLYELAGIDVRIQ